MAYWGQALVLGPNINAPMEPNEEPQAYELVQKAVVAEGSRARRASRRTSTRWRSATRERPRIGSRATRRTPTRCARCIEQFPDDLDAAMLYVESVMDLRPWGYWQRDGAPHERTADIVALTEQVIARNPKHPGARAPVHPPDGRDGDAGKGGAGGRHAADADAGGGPHGAHAGAHLSARGPLCGRDQEQRAGDRRRRGLHHAVPRAGPLPDGLLPAQPPLPLVRGDGRRAEQAGDRVGAQAGVEDR